MDCILHVGDRGENVKKLQSLLNEKLKPAPTIREDGVFGQITYKLVKKFQAINNLGIDGIVGPKTWVVLMGTVKTSGNPVATAPISTLSPWMKYAKDEINQKEIKGTTHNPRIISYHATTTLKANNDETPWCSSFVNWALKQADIKGTNSAAAISWLSWGKPSNAQTGAIIVIYNSKASNSNLTSSGNHVGFLVNESATHFFVLGGNQSDQVKISTYPKKSWKLKGYRWPSL